MTADEIRASLTDLDALALTLWGEARGESIEGKIAVANIIVNRAKAGDRYGIGIRGVCIHKSQFSCWWPWGGAANHAALLALAERQFTGGVVQIGDPLDECLWVAEGITGRRVADNTNGANHYYSPSGMIHQLVPRWAIGLEPCARIGRHVFFKL